MSIKRRFNIVFDRIISTLAYIAAVLVMFVMLSIAADVLLRNLAGINIQWAFEVSEHTVLFITFLSAAWLLKLNRHIDIDLITSRLSSRGKASMDMVTSAIGAAITLFITYRSFLTVIDTWQRNARTVTVLELPLAALIAIITIGSLLLFIQFLRRTHGYYLERQRSLHSGLIEKTEPQNME